MFLSLVRQQNLVADHQERGNVFGVERVGSCHYYLQRMQEHTRCEYPAHTAVHLILDNHSAHISRETRAWIAEQPAGRFEFTFTPKHGSWLNLVEGFFSKLTRSILRHIRVASKQELKDRLMAAVDYFNDDSVVHTWTYKLDKAA